MRTLLRRLRRWTGWVLSPVPWDDDLLRRTDFWCDKHWTLVLAIGADPVKATQAIMVGLALAERPMVPTRHACCTFTDATVRGALELCK